MSISDITNGFPMWIACIAGVFLIVFQATLFGLRTWKAGEKMGVTKEQMKKAAAASAITAIGPSVVILSGMLSLLVNLGAPLAWSRLSIVGGVMYESAAAGLGTQAVGVSLGEEVLTPEALTMAVWTMILCSIGWVLVSTFLANRMDRVSRKLINSHAGLYSAISSAALIGAFASLSVSHIISLNKNALACLLGAGFMILFLQLSQIEKLKWMKQWNLTFSILLATLITALI